MRIANSLCLAALFASGCFVFDEDLYQPVPHVDGELAEVCGATAPLLFFPEGAQSHGFDVDTRGSVDNSREVSGCTGRTQRGPDLFLSIDARRGEHWHFHVDVDPFEGRQTANPAIYVLDDCDECACSDGDGLDRCEAGSDEHFTFIPPADDTYVVGFDSPEDTGFEGRVLAFRTVCGDGSQDHSENCDDGNTDDGDGCSASCFSELTGAAPAEVEVNDDVYSANLVVMGLGDAVSVRGGLDAICEVDVFAVDVPAGASLFASLGDGAGACPAGLEDATLELIEVGSAGPTPRVSAGGAGGTCASIDESDALARDLEAGTYFLRVTLLRERPDALTYRLNLSLSAGT